MRASKVDAPLVTLSACPSGDRDGALALSVEAAAVIVSLSKGAIYDLLKSRDIKPKKVGTRTLTSSSPGSDSLGQG